VNLPKEIITNSKIVISQKHELFELLGYETRNKYSIKNEAGLELGFAAEQQKGIFSFLVRQFLGHWRRFDILFFNPQRQLLLKASHPFRWIWQRLEIFDSQNIKIGSIQQRFAIFTKSFDILDANDRVLLQIRSGFFSIWTFKFMRGGTEMAIVSKKWSGLLSEIFTDKDTFLIQYTNPSLTDVEKTLVLAAGMFVDLMYFERKAD
jgi:uncharacterized protein YxjI